MTETVRMSGMIRLDNAPNVVKYAWAFLLLRCVPMPELICLANIPVAAIAIPVKNVMSSSMGTPW